MCQMSIILEQDGKEEIILENASLLEVTQDGVRVAALFEEPRLIEGATVHSVDFLRGRVLVRKKEERA